MASVADPEIVVLRDAGLVAQFTATRLIAAVVDAQVARGSASMVLTGGGIGLAALQAVREHPARDAVDWSAVDVFWGDERFVGADDAERNDRGAGEALLDHIPLDERRVHRMLSSDEVGSPEESAARYAEVLAEFAGRDGLRDRLPSFDIVLLGMGPEGHVASIFPNAPAVKAEAMAVAVRDCPKAPPTRVSLTFPVIRNAAEVWLIVTTADKAAAVARAVAGADPNDVPAAGARGRNRTLFVLDRAAAGDLSSAGR